MKDIISNIKKSINKLNPSQIMVIGFASVILIGAILLSLPIATKTGESIPFVDALFTSTSAVCVTGLVVVDTATYWNLFGQIIIIILIQVGGLGFMTITTLFALITKKRINLRERLLIQEALNQIDLSGLVKLTRYVLLMTFIIEGIGALTLSTVFIPEFGIIKGTWYSIFHSISAFCNAGFDLFGDSLLSFTQNPLVIFTIAALIIVGGLGFIVWRDVLNFKKNRMLLVHTRLTLITTGSILLFSFVFFSISEISHGTFSGLSFSNQLMNTFFMAVTPRTAGYANVDYTTVSNVGIFLTLILMFIGASSGSTGGGIKVTTFATLVLYVKAKFKDEGIHFHKRGISRNKVNKSILIVFIGISIITIATMLLLITETIPPGFGFEYVLLEVFSCFGTVGLSMGLTTHITSIGKIILIVLMFAGRIGLLTFFISFGAHAEDRQPLITYPDENILVG